MPDALAPLVVQVLAERYRQDAVFRHAVDCVHGLLLDLPLDPPVTVAAVQLALAHYRDMADCDALVTVYIVVPPSRDVSTVHATYAQAYASIDAILRGYGLVADTPAWVAEHARWDIVQRVVQA